MIDTDNLNWNEGGASLIDNGKPQWFKMWGEKYATALDIENLDRDLKDHEKQALFEDVGRAFISALFYFMCRVNDETQYSVYKPLTRDGRILWNALKRDIDQSYRDYEKRVKNGAKGGRPPKKPETPANTDFKSIGNHW